MNDHTPLPLGGLAKACDLALSRDEPDPMIKPEREFQGAADSIRAILRGYGDANLSDDIEGLLNKMSLAASAMKENTQ